MTQEREIDFQKLFEALWSGKWTVVGITGAVSIIGIAIAVLTPDVYRAEALLVPNDFKDRGGLSSLVSQSGGLAALVGLNLNDGATDKIETGLKILKSRKFISEFINRHDIIVPLMAAEKWDSDTRKLKIDNDEFDVESGQWVRKVSPPKKTIPSSQEAYEEFMKVLTVSQDKSSGFVTVAVEHYSPDIARDWVDLLIQDLNRTVMRNDEAEAKEAIAYLNKQLEKTSLSELKNVLSRLVEEQTKTIMLVNISDEYLLRTIDPAVAPEKKVRPKRFLIALLSGLIGFVSGVFAVLLIRRIAARQ
jgi:uncharacterized protein involved in exopolysaccharide biosynthesis